MRKFTVRGHTTNVFEIDTKKFLEARIGKPCAYCSLSVRQIRKNPLGGYCSSKGSNEPYVNCGNNSICISSAKDFRRLPIALRKLILFK